MKKFLFVVGAIAVMALAPSLVDARPHRDRGWHGGGARYHAAPVYRSHRHGPRIIIVPHRRSCMVWSEWRQRFVNRCY